jgi:hypothetical protein
MPQLAAQEACVAVPTENTRLTDQEKVRLRTLIRAVERGMSTFLEVAKALAEIRGSRLYRETHKDFPSWCRDTLALARSHVDCLIRSGETAQLLIDNGIQLPTSTTEAVIRPVASLPSPELQSATWKLVEAASPKCGPTQPISSKIARVIKNAIELKGTNGYGHKPRNRSHPSRERPFVQAAQRLSAYKGFDAEIVISHVEKLPSAWSVYQACSNLIERCQLVQERLAERFPELTNA